MRRKKKGKRTNTNHFKKKTIHRKILKHKDKYIAKDANGREREQKEVLVEDQKKEEKEENSEYFCAFG